MRTGDNCADVRRRGRLWRTSAPPPRSLRARPKVEAQTENKFRKERPALVECGTFVCANGLRFSHMRSAYFGGEPRDFRAPRAIGVMRVASDRCYVFRKTNHARLPATPRDARGRQTGMRASRAYALAALLGCLFAAASADDECSGHGTYDSSSAKCACDDSTPAPGATGWVGDACEIETVGVATPTIAAPFVQSGTLEGGRWRCYFLAVDPGWNHLAVSLSHAEDDAATRRARRVLRAARGRSRDRARTGTTSERSPARRTRSWTSPSRAPTSTPTPPTPRISSSARKRRRRRHDVRDARGVLGVPTSFAPTHDAHDGSDVRIWSVPRRRPEQPPRPPSPRARATLTRARARARRTKTTRSRRRRTAAAITSRRLTTPSGSGSGRARRESISRSSASRTPGETRAASRRTPTRPCFPGRGAFTSSK